MLAVIGIGLILLGAGGVTGVLNIGPFTSLGAAILGAALLCTGWGSTRPDHHHTQPAQYRRRR